MYGPKPPGFWSTTSATTYKHLIAGRCYKVMQEFIDYDHFVHNVGEEWTFLGSSFLPYESGLSLFVSLDGSHEWQIRMQCISEQQGTIVQHLEMFIQASHNEDDR
jgi:hypothetical protein